MLMTLFLLVAMLVQAPTSRPSTQPAETYPALRKLLEKTQADLNAAITELRQLRDENKALRAELAAIRGREDAKRDVGAKFKLSPEQAAAFSERRVVTGMPLAAVRALWDPVELSQGYEDGQLIIYRVDAKVEWPAKGSGVYIREVSQVIEVSRATQLVTAVQGDPWVPPVTRVIR